MEINACNIVRDILPLYVENIICDDTKQFVDEHLNQCADCTKELALLKTDIQVEKKYQEPNLPIEAMKKVRWNIKKKRVSSGIMSAVISAIVVVLSFAYLTAPEYLPYTASIDIVTAHENNGRVMLAFTGKYELSQREPGAYSISLYNTVWTELFDTTQKQVIVVNPNGEKVNTIYYVSNGGQEDTVIYGANPIMNGGATTLPRLFLNYYFAIAIFIALVLTVLLLLFRNKQKAKTVIAETLFAPISYIVSHIMVTGLEATSYAATRDFYLILLLVIPIYFICYSLCKRLTRVLA